MIYLRLSLLVLVAVASVNSNFQEDMDEAKMQEMYNCFFSILCIARKPLEFRRVMMKADSNLIKCGFTWLKEISDIDGSDTPEFWESYPDYKCHLPEETKQEYFMEWMHRLGEYWANACANETCEECIKMAECEHEYNVVTAEYTANGICTSKATEMGGKKLEGGKETVEKGIGPMKSSMPMG